MRNNKFFLKLVELNNYIDPKTIKEIYYSFLELIMNELEREGVIYLVNFGSFRIKNVAERNFFDINERRVKRLSAKKVVCFRPSIKLSKHFNR